MKFLAKGNHLAEGAAMMRWCILLALMMVFFAWLTNLFLFAEKFGFSSRAVIDYYLGGEDSFRSPASYTGLLESSHFHFYNLALVLLLINHLAIFSGVRAEMKYLLLFSSFFSGFANIAAGWLIVYVGASFAVLKIAAFVVFQISTVCLIWLAIYSLLKPKAPSLSNVP